MTGLSADGMILCEDEKRSGVLRNPLHPLNGVDFVEFRRVPGHPTLDVTFLKPPPVPPAIGPINFALIGGVRIVDLKVVDVKISATDPLMLEVEVDREGDFSTYILDVAHILIDEELGQIAFSFKAGCPSEFDCLPVKDCPPTILNEPALDYMAKDYQSFRRLMVDLISERNPQWLERLPADLGMTLVELLAYASDYLSYFQDSGPGTEGFLETCMHRISAARHAKLIDYRMGQGRNAATFVHFVADVGANGFLPKSTKVISRVSAPLIGNVILPGPVISALADFDHDPALANVAVFETKQALHIIDLHNEIRIHTWGDTQCCLAQGATGLYLYCDQGGTAVRPDLKADEYILLEEVRSPKTGFPADANTVHRQVLLIGAVELTVDDAFTSTVAGSVLTPRLNVADPPLPLLKITFAKAEALSFLLCVSALTDDNRTIDPVTVARGNVCQADHGRSVVRDTQVHTLNLPDMGFGRWPLPTLELPDSPVTQTGLPDGPAVELNILFPAEAAPDTWSAVPDLLESSTFDHHFVVEVDNAGATTLRFGDDQYGRRPYDAERVTARYRIGNGEFGNCGWGTLVHVVTPLAVVIPDITRIWQPLPAFGGEEPETIEHVRQIAPEAFRAIQFRAVTERDWEEMALRNPAVAATKASFRWTGSWHTVFIAIHPLDANSLKRLPGGSVELQPTFAAEMKADLTRFKLAGYDLDIRAAIYVPLEINIRICVGDGHFTSDVLAEAYRLLSNRRFSDGSTGFFNLLRFGFGQGVYLSQLYEVLQSIAGVNSAEITLFKRYWEVPQGELDRGVIAMGAFEIPRLDNDLNFPENGVLRLSAVGGI